MTARRTAAALLGLSLLLASCSGQESNGSGDRAALTSGAERTPASATPSTQAASPSSGSPGRGWVASRPPWTRDGAPAGQSSAGPRTSRDGCR